MCGMRVTLHRSFCVISFLILSMVNMSKIAGVASVKGLRCCTHLFLG
jgi:hypothetical protein